MKCKYCSFEAEEVDCVYHMATEHQYSAQWKFLESLKPEKQFNQELTIKEKALQMAIECFRSMQASQTGERMLSDQIIDYAKQFEQYLKGE